MWYDDDWAYRHPVGVLSVATSATEDATIVLPSWWDQFWSAVQTNGEDVRLVEADGVTDLDFKLTGWDKSAKTGTIEIEDLPIPNTAAGRKLILVWIYYGNDAASAPTYTTHTPSSPGLGTVYLGAPSPDRVVAARLPPGEVNPAQEVGKLGDSSTTPDSADTLVLWWRLSDLLAGSWGRALNGRPYHDEWAYCYEASGHTGLYNAGTYKSKSAEYEEYIVGNGVYAYDRGELYVCTVIEGLEADADLVVRVAGAIVRPQANAAGNFETTYTAPVIIRGRTPTQVGS